MLPFLQFGTQRQDHGSGMDHDCGSSGSQQESIQPEVSSANLSLIYKIQKINANIFFFLQLARQLYDHRSGMVQDCRSCGSQHHPDQLEVSPATLPMIYF